MTDKDKIVDNVIAIFFFPILFPPLICLLLLYNKITENSVYISCNNLKNLYNTLQTSFRGYTF
ncbi:hypothetical protein C6356_16815 [Bacillus wiedmannii]|uniref:Uncharacterized protein n=1 Tax=Bacillus wiedmannii TaxID=1890302 RepID=A0ABX5DXI6_9BACI|nr:hypothetical protein C6356_16815 [Bacillus wiedmannii]PRT39923.1 hypothetical protein C6357_14835 [Bacillus wiedmannii]